MKEVKEILKMLGEIIVLLSDVVSICDKLIPLYTTPMIYQYPFNITGDEASSSDSPDDYHTIPKPNIFKEPETTFGK